MVLYALRYARKAKDHAVVCSSSSTELVDEDEPPEFALLPRPLLLVLLLRAYGEGK